MKNFIKDNTGLIIRFDDVAENMNWQTFTIIEKTLNELNIKPVNKVLYITNSGDTIIKEQFNNINFTKIVRGDIIIYLI